MILPGLRHRWQRRFGVVAGGGAVDFEVHIDPRDVKVEDHGQARYVDLVDPDAEDPDSGIFVQLHSWDEGNRRGHTEFEALVGRRVRVRIEPI